MIDKPDLMAQVSVLLGEAAELDLTKTGEVIALIDAADVPVVMSKLKDNKDRPFDYLRCLCGVDHPEGVSIVYVLRSLEQGDTLTVKTKPVKDNVPVASVTGLWPGANWHERETAELFGVTFDGHPDPRRLLTQDGDEGFPLRKEFKLDYGATD